jgi:hypothetical protein
MFLFLPMVDTRTARSRELAALKVRIWFEERRLIATFSAREHKFPKMSIYGNSRHNRVCDGK